MSDLRKLLDVIEEISESVELHDSFDIELSEDFVIETGVVGFTEDGIIVEGDDTVLELLSTHGILSESVDSEEYNDEAGMADNNLETMRRAVDGIDEIIEAGDNLPEWCQEKIAVAKSSLVAVWDYMKSEEERGAVQEAKYQGREVPLGKPMKGDKFYVALDFGGGLSNIEAVVKEKGQWRYTGLRSPTYKWSTLRYSPDDVVDRLQKYYDYTDSKSPIKRSRLIVRGPFSSEDEAQQAADNLSEAKYQGREVPLGKPMKGDVKKSKVYVRKPDGKVVKVNFGDKNMRIKKSNPGRRKNFRARHNCDNPGPRWKARYWSCRAW
jgi:hypothetical protein